MKRHTRRFFRFQWEYSSATVLRNILKYSSKDKDEILRAFGGADGFDKAVSSIESMDHDFSLPELDKQIFRHERGETGEEAAQKYLRISKSWDEGRRFSLPTIAREWLDILQLDEFSEDAKALILVAARAEMVKGMPCRDATKESREPVYHDRVHTMQVFQSVCYLIKAQYEMFNAWELQRLNHMSGEAHSLIEPYNKNAEKDDIFIRCGTPSPILLMIAAMAHDIDHPGRKNPADPVTGKPISFYNENIAALAIRPILIGVYGEEKGEKMFVDILRLIQYTDPNEPRREATAAIAAVRNDPSQAAPEAQIFWNGVAILCDADLLLSTGMGHEAHAANARKLTDEAHKAGLSMNFNTAASAKFFFDNIVGPQGMLSAPGRFIFNPSYQELYKRNEKILAEQPKLAA